MIKKDIIKRALDATNGFILSESSEAQAVNPNIWDFRLRDYVEKNIIVTPLAEQFDFRGAGVDYKVTIDEAPSLAAALVETTDITVSAFSTRNTTFTPTEYGAGYQLTRKEAVRAFFNVADRMVKKLGYSLALKRDAVAVSTLRSGAGNTLVANSVAVASDIASTDTLSYSLITNGKKTIENKFYVPKALLINYTQKKHLLDESAVYSANIFGTRSAVEKGLLGELFGMEVYASHSISNDTTNTDTAKAIILGETPTGEQAFGFAIKRDALIEKEYHARGRYWDIVAHEEWDFQILHADAVCLLHTYS